MKYDKKGKSGMRYLGLAFIFLITPNVNVFDILPDFFAFFIIAKKLEYAIDRAPFFQEARDAFKKLGVVTLIKIPASLLMTSFRSKNVGDNDIRALFAITFAAIEIVLLISAINNLFAAFSYLGQRSDNTALISDFKTNKKGTKSMSADGLKVLTFVFVFYKEFMSFVPETLLLTRTVSASEYATTFNVARLYPYTVVFGIITVVWFGIIWQRRFKCYLRAIRDNGGFRSALDSMLDDSKRAELDTKQRVDGMYFALTLLALSSAMTVELRFDNLKGINLLPPFVFAFIMMFASMRLSRFAGNKASTVILGAGFTVATFARYLMEFSFLEKYGYEALTLDSFAKSSYKTLMITFGIETLIFIAFTIVVGKSLINFVMTHTGIEVTSERYSRQDKDYHDYLKRKVYILTGLCILVWLVKLADCILRYFSKNTLVPIEGQVNNGDLSFIQSDVGIVNESVIPWFGVIVLLSSILYIIYAFCFVSQLKEDVEMKYIKV